MDALTLAAASAITCLAGVVRGITGFGGAMVMAPPLALLLGPSIAVPVVLLLESLAATPMVVQTRRLADWRMVGVILAAAAFTAPLGALLLVGGDPEWVRRAIAATVVAFALAMLRGWRYGGRPRLAASVGVGFVSGGMLGATGMAGPPIVLYLLWGQDAIATIRANLALYVAAASLVGVVAILIHGGLDASAGWTTLWLAPAYWVGLAGGVRLFARFDELRFRQLTLVILIAVSVGILLV